MLLFHLTMILTFSLHSGSPAEAAQAPTGNSPDVAIQRQLSGDVAQDG